MGCCSSTPRASAASPAPSRPTTGRSSTAPRPPIIPSETTRATVLSTGTSTTFTTGNSTSRPNAPLRAPRPWHTAAHPNPTHPDQPWTPRSLRQEREAFFDTRVSGRPEVWAAVKLTAEMMRENPADLSAAQGVLDAAGVTVPRGRIEDGAWDERGMLYKCPPWAVSDPVDLTQGGDEDDEEEDEDEDMIVGECTKETEVVDELENKNLGKGKGKLVAGDNALKVRARLSDRGMDVVAVIEKKQTVKTLAKNILEQAKLPAGTKIKLAYLGKMLKENQTLEQQGWQAGHIVNAFVFQ